MSNFMPRMLLCLALPLFAGCPGSVSQTRPEEVVSMHLQAAREGDRQGASVWLSLEARQRGYRWPQPELLPKGEPQEVRRMAIWRLPSGGRVEVQRQAGGWKILQGVLSLDAADTPQQTVLVFARAIESRDYEALIRLMPMPERRRWSPKRLSVLLEERTVRAAWTALAAALRARQDPIEVVWVVPGRHARIAVPMQNHIANVELIAQDQAWKVLDVTPRRLYTPAR